MPNENQETHGTGAPALVPSAPICSRSRAESVDAMYHKVVMAALECDPIPASERDDDRLEPPWEVMDRMRRERDEAIADLRNLANWMLANEKEGERTTKLLLDKGWPVHKLAVKWQPIPENIAKDCDDTAKALAAMDSENVEHTNGEQQQP